MSPFVEVRVEKGIADEISNFIKEKPKYGYHSVEEFIKDSLRYLMLQSVYNR